MKFTRITAISAITVTAAFGLGACSEKPLSNEEACQEIINQAKEQKLDMHTSSSLGDMVDQGQKVSSIFHGVAQKAEPELATELNAFAEDTDALLAVVTDDSLDMQQMRTKMSLLDTQETRARSENMGKLCPGLENL
ncbi:hypothetical protein [Glutamicibacter sp.]|jgi:hypothetical protein|uniref:hypothetical protein n=1 Tax=Glutamicibacter sp. TaxID=1931995 RepID=UPI002B481F34|nr:hypothetical protein [Glutamicibacter sp.]HJX79892.1 hypothetical protein [Glutamicibacter sp.]